MVFVTTSGPSVCISPWKDGLKPREIVRHSHQNIRSVLVIFPENLPGNERNILSESELIELFKVIANEMPSVRSITISGGSYQSQPTSSSSAAKIDRGGRVVPPLKAITSLLRGNSGQLLALSLIQIRLMGSQRDYRDFISAIQRHRTLQSFDCSGCVFEKRVHAASLRETCQDKRLLYFMFDGGVVLEPPEPEEQEDDRIKFAGDDSTVRTLTTNTTDDSAWGSVLSWHNRYLCWCI